MLRYFCRLAALVCLLPLRAAFAADGDLDTSFWTDGKVLLSSADSFTVEEVLAAPDGRLVVVGTHTGAGGDEWYWRAVSATTAGSACNFFPPGGASRGRALAARFDGAGRLVVAGSARYGSDRLAVARFTYPTCSLDTNFDGDGYYTLDLPGGSEELAALDVSAIGILTFGGYRHGATHNDMVLLQLNDNGAPITSFSSDGWLTLDVSGAELDDGVVAVAVDAQNRVVAGGSTHYGTNGDNSDFVVARFTAAGLLDTSFDGDGVARVGFDLGGGELVYDETFDMALDPATGAIVLAGYARALSTFDLAIARLTPQGQLDTGFSADGKVNNNFGFGYVRANAILLDGLGRITIGGTAEPFNGSGGADFFAARYLPSGTLDSSFSGNGWTTVPFDVGPSSWEDDTARAATFQAGRLALAGEVTRDASGNTANALTRFDNALVFADGFASASTRQWSSTTGGGP
ncbi:MAG: hypothetical protein KBA72_07445 [Thermoanaerobaculia bacterium]|nr:hypothetical protein [Thermoanaerobaculia bacterium]